MARIHYRLDDLRALVALKRSASFVRAAALLHITQSAFSRRIAQLEQAVGGQLVERTSRRVALSPLGHELVQSAARLLTELDATLDETARHARGESGRLVVACLTTVACAQLPAVLARFRQAFPGIRLQVRDDTGQRVTQAVLQREAEFGISVVGQGHQGLHVQVIADDPFVLALAPGHPLARRRHIAWSELAAWHPVSLRATSANRVQIDEALEAAGIDPPWFDEVEHLSTMLGFLRHGGAIGVLPRLALDAGTRDLLIRPLTGPAIQRQIGLIRRAEASLGQPAQQLWDLLADSRLGLGVADAAAPSPRRRMGRRP